MALVNDNKEQQGEQAVAASTSTSTTSAADEVSLSSSSSSSEGETENKSQSQESHTLPTPTAMTSPGGAILTVKEHLDYGRYVLTTCAVPRKGLILSEMPIMCAPWPIDDNVGFDEPLCLGCCMHMKRTKDSMNQEDIDVIREMKVETDEEYFNRLMRKVPRCSKCNWPVCCKSCEENALHRDNECGLFAASKLPYPPPGENMNIVTTSVMIQLIRCLLVKKYSKEIWFNSVLKLQSSTAMGTLPWNFHLLLDDIKEIMPEVERDLGSREECCKILSIININAFSNTFNHNGEFSGCSICLFLESSMISHSCSPNSWWNLEDNPTHRIVIKACEDIPAGEMITVCYSNQYSVFGTQKREEMFKNVGGFTCKCRRCLDPSELGSMVSGVLCEHCMNGYNLPEIPTDPESPWKCYLCGHDQSAEMILTIVKALENRLFSIIEQQKQPVPLLVRFLENCKSLVHNNHWIVTQTEDAIMKEWAKDPDVRFGGTSPQDILMTCEYFISLCFHVLSVRNIVSPGLSFHRARYLLFYARTRMARLEFMVSMVENPSRYNLPANVTAAILANSEEIKGFQKKRAGGQDDSHFQSIREEFQEILQLYHEVMEYRQMSNSTDEEIKGEIEHLIRLLTPIVQMEPHHKQILQLVGSREANCQKKENSNEKGICNGEANDKEKESERGNDNGDGGGCTLT